MPITSKQRALLKDGGIVLKLTEEQLDILLSLIREEMKEKITAMIEPLTRNDMALNKKLHQERVKLARIDVRLEEGREQL